MPSYPMPTTPTPQGVPVPPTMPTMLGAGNTPNFFHPQQEVHKPTQAPLYLLWIALAMVLVGVVVALLVPSLYAAIAAWVLCAFGALGMTMVFTRKDAQEQANPLYFHSAANRYWYVSTIITTIIGVTICAIEIALYMGRL